MMDDVARAWNNFVLNSYPFRPGINDIRRCATVANMFMALANNGGINSFLTSTYELGGQEVVDALAAMGATSAAGQLRAVLVGLDEPLVPSSAEARWSTLDRLWSDELDAFDVLSEQADIELLQVLQRHVENEIAYYLTLRECQPDGR